MMTNTSVSLLKLLLIVDVILALVSIIFFDYKVLLNTQIGFISSSLVMFASLMAYRRMVNARVEYNVVTYDDSKDVIDKLEDPYDLYSEEVSEAKEEDLVEVVKEERKKLKDNRSLLQTLKDTKAALSIYRLGAYAVLILGFLYLNRNEYLHIGSYILALGLPPIIIVIQLLRQKS